MTKKQRREAREANKIARGMERRLLRGTFKQELSSLRFEDIKFQGNTTQLMNDLTDKECLGYVIGENLGLSADETRKIMHDHENSLAYNAHGDLSRLLKSPHPVLDKYSLRKSKLYVKLHPR